MVLVGVMVAVVGSGVSGVGGVVVVGGVVACLVGCTRSCLNLFASDKGLVVRKFTFLEDGDHSTQLNRFWWW